MELRHLRYFIAVAEGQNVTHAAARLNISQPALSRQIRDLEDILGVSLFTRGANVVHLTDAGKAFLHDCRAILRKVDDAVDKVKWGKREKLRIGYAASPTADILSPALRRFQDSHPYVTVTLHDMTSKALLDGIRNHKLDVALTVSVSPADFFGLSYDQLAAYEVRVACANGHRFAKSLSIALADIAAEPHITWTKDDHPEAHAALQKMLSPYVEEPPVVMECDSAPSLIAAVESGKGVALVLQTLSKVAGKCISLRAVTPPQPLLPVAVIYHKQRLSAAATDFIATLKTAPRKASQAKKPVLVV